jgi:hypothetical protein
LALDKTTSGGAEGEAAMSRGKTKVKAAASKKALERTYKNHENHPLWQRIYKGVSDLIENHDLVERNARDHIVRHLFKALRPKKKKNKRKKAVAQPRRRK